MNYKRVEEILAEAAALETPSERLDYVDKACGGDKEMRAELERLLQAKEQLGDFLERPIFPEPPLMSLKSAPFEKSGEKIGPYKLLEPLGEGGWGMVYLAEQQEPIRRFVALKVIKRGMDTKQVIARFEAERQALALMDHPNIAKVLDAGATEAGRPCFVMELVRGVKITRYCDENRLSIEERLRLFIPLCHAIQHAHQKGIIHRDLKPSNILVTVQDNVAVPKVIDFGIVKAAGQQLTDKTVFTGVDQFVGTPAYMSPEQVEGGGLDIDTRSDIYALGVLLYELLTGYTPFEEKELREAGLDGMRRMIREREPLRPSTRLRGLEPKQIERIAESRAAEPAQLIRSMAGDLDWVTIKCLEKDRQRRYDTADGLAGDLLRHLNCEPVLARPPSGTYRLQKLVRRNSLVFGAGAAVVFALVIGLGTSTRLFVTEREAKQRAMIAERTEIALRRQAEANEKKAQNEARKSEQVAQFLRDMLGSVRPSVALGKDTVLLKEILDRAAERVGKDLLGQYAAQAELCDTIGQAYQEIGRYPQAVAMYRQAVNAGEKAYGHDSEAVANSLRPLSSCLWAVFDQEAAVGAATEAVGICRRLKAEGAQTELAKSLENLARLLQRYHPSKDAEAERACREALALEKGIFGECNTNSASSLVTLALILAGNERFDEAIRAAEESLLIRKSILGTNSAAVADSTFILGRMMMLSGDSNGAEVRFRESLFIQLKLDPEGSLALVRVNFFLAELLMAQGATKEAEEYFRTSLAFIKKLGLQDDMRNWWVASVCGLSQILQKRNNLPAARQVYDEALELAKGGGPVPKPSGATANLLFSFGKFLERSGDVQGAERIYGLFITNATALHGVRDRHLTSPICFLARFYEAHGEWSKAQKWWFERNIIEPSTALWESSLAGPDLVPVIADSQVVAGEWKYSTNTPPRTWLETAFDDSGWLTGEAGFGEMGTSADEPRSSWLGGDIWLRREFYLTNLPSSNLVCRLYFDDYGSVYLNGVTAVPWESAAPWGYIICRITDASKRALRIGRNVLAVHCHNDTRDPFADAGIYELQDPELGQKRALQILKRRMAREPQNSNVLRLQGEVLAHLGRWAEAAYAYARTIDSQPTNHELYHATASLLAASGDLEAYRQHCQKIIATFGRTEDATTAHRMAKACSILEVEGLDLRAVKRMADVAISAGDSHWGWVAHLTSKSMAEYRSKNHQATVEWAEKALGQKKGWFAPEFKAQAYFLLAMGQYRLGFAERGQATLAEGMKLVEDLPRSGGAIPGSIDWIIAHAYAREATELILGRASFCPLAPLKFRSGNNPVISLSGSIQEPIPSSN